MQKKLTIISTLRIPSGNDTAPQNEIKTFDEDYKGARHVEETMKKDLSTDSLPDEVKKKIREICQTDKPSCLSYDAAGDRVIVSWDFVRGDSNVSDEELIGTIEQYCNANRTQSEYDAVARRATDTMHRYCQNEMYRLVAGLIRAMASCSYDERNVRMHNRARMIAEFMDKCNL